jgi:DNA recombination protein RmuC
MDGYVRELERKREGAYQRLQEQLQNLATTHSELQTTTINLSQALKSPTVRGRWGEMQLRRVVEMAGMVKHVTYDEQVTTDGGRPDMIAYLPNGGVLPVDSKVPLAAYLDAMEAKDEETRRTKLGKHAKAMQDRIQELSQKKYWEQFDNTPDFVVMFVPNEACLGAAFEINPSLLEYGIEKHVLISTPVTLLALLRAVAYGWQQQQITENARQIAEQGRELYRRLETFIGHMAELRKDLNKTVDGYNKAVGSLERRLLPAARRFEEMGVTASELDVPQTIDTQAKLPTK